MLLGNRNSLIYHRQQGLPPVKISDLGLTANRVWSFDFNGNGEDSVGSYDLTLSGATYTGGLSGQAISFDGVNDYAYHTAAGAIPVTTTATMAMIFKPTDLASDQLLFGNSDGGSFSFRFFRVDGTTGNIDVVLQSDGVSNTINPVPQVVGKNAVAGQWNLLVWRFNNPGQSEVWLNGVKGTSASSIANLLWNGSPTNVISFGANRNAVSPDGFSGFFKGAIDACVLWSSSLTDQNIADLWSDGRMFNPN